jgi:hypothetical protein
MSNVIRFPHQAQPEPASDQLMALEIELVRARLAQVRSAVMLWLIVMFASAGRAQSTTRSYYNSSGSFAGSSTTRGNTSSFYNNQGGFAGSAVRHGSSTSFYDGQGRYSGSSVGTSPRR